MKFHLKALLQNEGWIENAVLTTDEEGVIRSIEPDQESAGCDEIISGYVLPGFQNAHSHSFQYAMAGIAERHFKDSSADDFWGWRNAMYKIALSVSPEQFESIAAMLYAELLRHGYTNVAEFHYLHHDIYGKAYINPAEMGSRLVSAAKRTGINITLIPIFYQKGGFGKPPEDAQRRFISPDLPEYTRLFEASQKAADEYEGANTAIGIHSMRGVEPETIVAAAEEMPRNIPFHIHIAEQLKEVADCEAFLGSRPVEWMLGNLDLSDRFHFVHATHLTGKEIYELARSKTNVVLCPTTEGNLGDGIFPLRKFHDHGGNWSIGTDSHVSLNPFEELRLLDYGQRTVSHSRNTFAVRGHENSAAFAIDQALLAGRRAMNNYESRYFKVGEPFNACIISDKHPLIQTASKDNLLNTILYSTDETAQTGTISRGRLVSIDGKHIQQDEFVADFVKTMKGLDIR
ncbi:MAG: formimidoylglutamate deiminase [Pyrinomonadaceae bacterium]